MITNNLDGWFARTTRELERGIIPREFRVITKRAEWHDTLELIDLFDLTLGDVQSQVDLVGSPYIFDLTGRDNIGWPKAFMIIVGNPETDITTTYPFLVQGGHALITGSTLHTTLSGMALPVERQSMLPVLGGRLYEALVQKGQTYMNQALILFINPLKKTPDEMVEYFFWQYRAFLQKKESAKTRPRGAFMQARKVINYLGTNPR